MAIINPVLPLSATVTQPAAGANFTITAPAGQTLAIKNLAATFATSATVANRNIGFTLKDASGNIVAYMYNLTNMTAGATISVMLGPGMSTSAAVGTMAQVGGPNEILLAPGWTLNSAPINLQSGDQWSAIAYSYTIIG
jgi:hypothetical protein